MACAALLHDAVEDHADGIAHGGARPAALAVLAGRFGAGWFGDRAAGLVAAVTNPEWEVGRDEHRCDRAPRSPGEGRRVRRRWLRARGSR